MARRGALLPILAGALLAACATGQRPSFDDEQPAQTSTGDAPIDAVLDRLDAIDVARFTATYDVTTRFGDIHSEAIVVQAADGRRSITVNDVRFVIGDGTDSTCNLAVGECEASINDARISDLGLTHEFYAASFAARLRADAGRRVGDTTGYTEISPGGTATCVDVPLAGITKSYCALDSGLLSRYEGNDLLIELTAFSDTPDERAFETG